MLAVNAFRLGGCVHGLGTKRDRRPVWSLLRGFPPIRSCFGGQVESARLRWLNHCLADHVVDVLFLVSLRTVNAEVECVDRRVIGGWRGESGIDGCMSLLFANSEGDFHHAAWSGAGLRQLHAETPGWRSR